MSVARLGRVTMHAHPATALLIGLDGKFAFRLAPSSEPWVSAEQVVVARGTRHELDCGDTLVGVVYLAPGLVDHRQYCERMELVPTAPVHIVARCMRTRSALCATHAGELGGQELAVWLEELVGPCPTRRAEDERVHEAATLIAAHAPSPWKLEALARQTGISSSRLQHLFHEELGSTPRRLRTWERLRSLTALVASGESLTRAAQGAGFVDSAHLSRAFRDSLGIPPSRVLSPKARLRVHDALSGETKGS